MSESPAPTPYIPTPTAPNSSCFIDPNKTILSLATASKFFFLKSGDFANYVNSNLYQLGGSQILMSALTSVTAGTAAASKALVLDASSNITGVNNFTFTGSLSGSIINSSSYLLAGSNITMSALTGITLGAVTANKALTVDASSNITGSLNISRNGSHISLVNGANSSLIEHSASPNMLRLVGPTYNINLATLGIGIYAGASTQPRYPLDFGAATADLQIVLNQTTAGSTSAYGFGANNSSLESHSGGDFTWYIGTTASGSLGTKRATLSSGGNWACTSGFFTGFTSSGLSTGEGLKCHYGNNGSINIGQLFAYDYGATAFKHLVLGNNNIHCGINGHCNLNTTNTTTVCPLAIYGNGSFTRSTGNFGFLRSSAPAADTAPTPVTRNYSLYLASGLISDSELNVFCDRRKKKDIKDLDEDMASKFINMMKPVSFKYKKDNDKNTTFGYIAQDMIKYNLNDLVGITDVYAEDGDEPLEEEEIVTDSGEVFYLPSDVSLSVNLLSIIPILHLYIKKQDKKINQNNKLIHELNNKIIELLQRTVPSETGAEGVHE